MSKFSPEIQKILDEQKARNRERVEQARQNLINNRLDTIQEAENLKFLISMGYVSPTARINQRKPPSLWSEMIGIIKAVFEAKGYKPKK